MDEIEADYPQWLKDQRGCTYRGQGNIPPGAGPWLSRDKLVRRYADHLIEAGQPVTINAIRDMLRFVDRGYSLAADQIGRALAHRYSIGAVARYTNGSAVVIDGRIHPSIRAAARAEGVSPQTVINRVASDGPDWRGWCRPG